MKKFLIVLGILMGTGVLAQARVHATRAYDELNSDQKAQIQRGESLFFTEKQSPNGSPWPPAHYYKRLVATPEEAAAVFWDFNNHSHFIPNLEKSSISGGSGARLLVDYVVVAVPIIHWTESYTVKNILTAPVLGDQYRIDWKLDHAQTTRATVGNIRFEKLGSGTLMAYYNNVTPGDGIAQYGVEAALQMMNDTADAIATRIEKEHASQSSLLQKELIVLRKALNE